MSRPTRRSRLHRARPAASLLTAVAVVCATLLGPAAAAPGAASAAELVLRGRGYGHGVGMTHDGALALGRRGLTAAQILETFYPGTVLGRGAGDVRVLVHDGEPTAPFAVRLPGGGRVRPARGPVAGLPLEVAPGGVVSITAGPASVTVSVPGHALRPRVPGTRTVTAPRSVLVIPDTVAATDATGTHRGLLHVVAGEGRLRAVVHLDVETYLRGMGEVRDSSWPAASLRAQAIAARTYALHAARYTPRHADFDVYADDRSQIYLGAQAEYDAMDAAVADTAGRVLRYEGAIANAVYSTNGGGVTATAMEGFGPSRLRHPYLTAVRYPTADPLAWTYRAPLAQVARKLAYPGRITGLRVLRSGPSGRALAIGVVGTAGGREIPALAVAERLGLKSTLFAVVRPTPPTPPRAARSAVLSRVAPALPATAVAAAAAPQMRRAPDVTAGRRVASGIASMLIAVVATALLGCLGDRDRSRPPTRRRAVGSDS